MNKHLVGTKINEIIWFYFLLVLTSTVYKLLQNTFHGKFWDIY